MIKSVRKYEVSVKRHSYLVTSAFLQLLDIAV